MLDQGTVVGGYRIEEPLGHGGMGAVFRARELKSGRVVALKLIAEGSAAGPVSLARFQGEGRAQALLEHPNIVTVYDAGESEHGLYLAMRLIDGPPLVDLIYDRALDARRALALLEQVADALDAAHSVGMVHRDVKPENVLVASGDHAFLADFGLTRAGAERPLTDSGQLVGTVAYLAPEVVRGGEATAASDRYAFAAIAFECLTGTVVFPRASGPSVLFAHASDPPPQIGGRRPELGTSLDDVFYRALAKDPATRPKTCAALVEQIRRELERAGAIELPPPPPVGAAALAGPEGSTSGGTGVPDFPPQLPPRRSRGKLALFGVAAALVGAAVAVLASSLIPDSDEVPAVERIAKDLPGLTYLGADLNGSHPRTLDCRGRAVTADSPPCTILQSELPGATIVVPRSGVIRDWQVRGARGEMRLVVTRPRDGGSFQVARSTLETAGSGNVQRFDSDVAVERGDLVGLAVSPGAGIGARDGIAGATTDRWLPALTGYPPRPPDHGPGSGFDHELLLRVGLLPGGERLPLAVAVTGREAASLPAGKMLDRRRLKIDEHRYVMALVEVDGRIYLDQLEGGERRARIEVPSMRDGARLVRFATAQWDVGLGGIDVYFVNVDSARVTERGFEIGENGLVSLG